MPGEFPTATGGHRDFASMACNTPATSSASEGWVCPWSLFFAWVKYGIGTILCFLVGGIPTLLKNMKVSWDYYSQYMESHKIHVPNHQSGTVRYNSIGAGHPCNHWSLPPTSCMGKCVELVLAKPGTLRTLARSQSRAVHDVGFRSPPIFRDFRLRHWGLAPPVHFLGMGFPFSYGALLSLLRVHGGHWASPKSNSRG